MASTVASASPGTGEGGGSEVSLARLYVLRALYLSWVIGGFFAALPPLIDPDPTARGMLPSMLGGLWVTAFFGVRYPLQMLPIVLFEFAWKTIWVIAYGLPQWMAGVATPQLREDLIAIGNGPILFAIVIPWGYVYRHYIKQPATRWR